VKSNIKVSLSQLRNEQYEHHNDKRFPEMHQLYRSPYSWFKARFYMELSSICVYFLLKTNLNPNTITIAYCLAAVVGAALIASANSSLVIIGVFIFFSKGILDWSDGHYARKIGKTSLTGHILDVYGATLGSVCLGVGLGIFVEARNESILVHYLIILLPIFRILLLTNYSLSILFKKILDSDYSHDKASKASEKIKKVDIRDSSIFSFAYKLIYNILDDRARTVDFIGFIIILDLYFNSNYTYYLFIIWSIKWCVAYIGSFYVVAKGGWVENENKAIIKSITSNY